MTGTLAGQRLTMARLELPYTGLWHAYASLDEPAVLSGQVTLVLGGLSLVGTVVAGDAYAGAADYRIVGGAGGWRGELPAKGYQNDDGVMLSLVLADAAAEAGETVSLAAGVDRAIGPAYDRPQAPGIRTLSLLAQTPFWIDSAGVTQVGVRPNVPVSGAFELVHYEPTDRMALVASETPEDFTNGCTVELPGAPAMTIGTIVHHLEGGSIRTELWASMPTEGERLFTALRSIIQELAPDLFYRGVFEYHMVAQNGLRLDLQPARATIGLPDLRSVQMRPGLAGGAAQLATGASVLVAFVDADPARPVVVSYTAPDDVAADPTALVLVNSSETDHIIVSAPTGRVVRYGDKVSIPVAGGAAVGLVSNRPKRDGRVEGDRMTAPAPGLADYGTDIFGVDDIDELGRDVTGLDVLRQAIARRLITPRGWLLDDPNYGYNVRAELSSAIDRGRLLQIQSKVKAEVLKDPRVLTCNVVATLSGPLSAQVVKLHVDGQARQGPYDLVVSVDKVTTQLLQTGGA